MKNNAIELPISLHRPLYTTKVLILPIITLTLLVTIHVYSQNFKKPIITGSVPPTSNTTSNDPRSSKLDHEAVSLAANTSSDALSSSHSEAKFKGNYNGSSNLSSQQEAKTVVRNTTYNESKGSSSEYECNIFHGEWVLDKNREMYYTNETKCGRDDRQNCMKFGRNDTEFLKWKWKPDECELARFDALDFLELVKGKKLAFVGDSVGRNQMQSLICMLSSVATPVDVSYVDDPDFKRWFYPSHNFTVVALWSPLLVKSLDPNPESFSRDSLMNLYLDEADEDWLNDVHNMDIIIMSAGQWFFRPYIYYEKGEIIGCFNCNKENITAVSMYYAYGKAFQTAFTALLSLPNYKGLTFLRTFTPQHFENGDWNNGGNCPRTRPFGKQEMKLDGYRLQMYTTQVEQYRRFEKEAINRDRKFRLLDITEPMILRPDGHPNYFGRYLPNENKTYADCVHWCMPGPVDTWNEFLLQMLKMEEASVNRELQGNA